MQIENLLPELATKIDNNLIHSIASVLQARTDYQLEHFVINQHDTDEMRYKQCLLEIQSLYYAIKIINLEMKKSQIEIDNLLKTGNEIDKIDAEIKEIKLEQTILAGQGVHQELDKLLEIYNSFQKKYSKDEIESGQFDYWDKRLRRQSFFQELGGSANQASHLEALRQTGAISFNYEKGEIIMNQLEIK